MKCASCHVMKGEGGYVFGEPVCQMCASFWSWRDKVQDLSDWSDDFYLSQKEW
jgi:hypothetical protein